MSGAPVPYRPPEVRTEPIEDLVRLAQRGRIRVPAFQRPLKWRTQDVLALFDSIYRGFPIGSLLLFRRPSPAGPLRLGPLHINAPEVSDAWWVIDGQQRITALAAGLTRPLPLPLHPEDPYVVYFDVGNSAAPRFIAPPQSGLLPDTCVPLPLLLDATQLGQWLMTWAHRGDTERVRAVFEAGKRLREYRLQLYLVDTDDPDSIRELFFRVNTSGHPLQWDEVHDALYQREGPEPTTVAELGREVGKLGMGQPSGAELTTCLLALRRLELSKSLAEHHRRDPELLRGAVVEALPVLRRVLSFLREAAQIPHLRLFPRPALLPVLVRFFAQHPEPGPRSRTLLTRFIWRALLSPRMPSDRTLRVRGTEAVSADEEASVQGLLSILPRSMQPLGILGTLDRTQPRLMQLTMAMQAPQPLDGGPPVDVAASIEALGPAAFRRIVPPGQAPATQLRQIENRILLPGAGYALAALQSRIQEAGPEDPWLLSHAVSPDAAKAMLAGELAGFLLQRRIHLALCFSHISLQLTGWMRHDNDRPSLAYLLRQLQAPDEPDDEQATPGLRGRTNEPA